MSWNEFYEVGLGVLSIPYSEFMKMTPRELGLAYNGYRRRMDEERELLRHHIYWMALPNVKKGFKIDQIKLPGDKVEPISERKMVRIRKIDE